MDDAVDRIRKERELGQLLAEIEILQAEIRAAEHHRMLSRDDANRLLSRLAPCVLELRAARQG